MPEEVMQSLSVRELVTSSIRLSGMTENIGMKQLTGVTGASEGDTTSMAHGLSSNDIIGVQVFISDGSGNWIPPAYTDVAEKEYYFHFNATNVVVDLHATNSGSINGGTNIKVLITYEA